MNEVQLIDHMGSDLSISNAARVSNDKVSDWDTVGPFQNIPPVGEDAQARPGNLVTGSPEGFTYQRLNDKDAGLIRFLAVNGHESPFHHGVLQFRIKMPLALARQWYKHRIGIEKDCGWNEMSRRYVDDTPEFFMPAAWRKRAANVKQGSSDEAVTTAFTGKSLHNLVQAHYTASRLLYEGMLFEGVAPELARLVLPTATMTEWIETGSVMAYARIVKLREDAHAQKDIHPYAQTVSDECSKLFPISWAALMQANI